MTEISNTTGIIYSDIGTSPLYTLNGIWSPSGPAPPKEDVIGAISAIIWSLTLVPLVKYALISLKFGTGEGLSFVQRALDSTHFPIGEGGAFALFQGLFPREHYNAEMERSLTTDSKNTRKSSTAHLPSFLRWPLLLWVCVLFGHRVLYTDAPSL
jgi:KUP system potassium uptake protein